MSTILSTTGPGFRDTVGSECVKASTMPALPPLLGVGAAVAVGVGALLSAVAGDGYSALAPAAKHVFDPVATALSAMPYADVIVAAIAVTLVASEYGTGMMRLSLTATPNRWRALGARLLVVGGGGLIAGVVFAAVSAAVGVHLLSARGVPTPGLADGAVLAAILGAGVGTAFVAVLGTCLAFMLRRTAPAVALTNVIAFLPGILYALPDWWQRHVIAYLPTWASSSLAGTVAGRSPAHLSTGTAYAVIACWAAVLVVAAGLLLTRRDA